jgi:hypothetical protein
VHQLFFQYENAWIILISHFAGTFELHFLGIVRRAGVGFAFVSCFLRRGESSESETRLRPDHISSKFKTWNLP